MTMIIEEVQEMAKKIGDFYPEQKCSLSLLLPMDIDETKIKGLESKIRELGCCSFLRRTAVGVELVIIGLK